ncbi:MKLN1 [Bugula neritina]|uniref:MKLN1 n=1 Tax=Bugula neritina TaxID=10212 RepID=A0A7J7K4D1_BUGNE|nr:MKLN1 [Bugula neritina]
MACAQSNVADFRQDVLLYSVVDWSSCTLQPSNTAKDCPNNHTFRWISQTTSHSQFLLLKLDEVSILSTITFSKFVRPHVCNLKRFKVYAGLTKNNMTEVYDGGLRNDNVSETFHVNNKYESHLLPVEYVRIEPLDIWGKSFSFCIWQIGLHGTTNSDVVKRNVTYYNKRKEDQAIRVCLKHFREQGYDEAFEALKKKTKIDLEDPILETLHKFLVKEGNYEEVERNLEKSIQSELFEPCVSDQELEVKWSKIEPVNVDGSDFRPGPRGGHQMVMNVNTETLYLYGGWDGQKDLADFWSFHVPSQQWTLISSDTEADGGPPARSCHKMVIDCERKLLFVLGRYLEGSCRTEETLMSEFYMYDIKQGKWVILSADTFSDGGPLLIYDHQMCIDTERQIIYVFGGKAQSAIHAMDFSACSGLFSYHIPTGQWKRLRADGSDMRSRFGHSMMLDHTDQTLYIFAGQRGKEFLNDLLVYYIETDVVEVISTHQSSKLFFPEPLGACIMPPAGYTQRATLDIDKKKIYILLSMDKMMKDNDNVNVKNLIWVYDLTTKSWSVLTNQTVAAGCFLPEYPVPRFAHQLVYDKCKKMHYMFGGNPGASANSLRLDDFWSLTLSRPSKEAIIRKYKLLIRKHKYKELIAEDPLAAVIYLQKDVYEVVDHKCDTESKEFQKLPSLLFDDTNNKKDQRSFLHSSRCKLFDKLVRLYPSAMRQPKDNLLDFVK